MQKNRQRNKKQKYLPDNINPFQAESSQGENAKISIADCYKVMTAIFNSACIVEKVLIILDIEAALNFVLEDMVSTIWENMFGRVGGV